MYPLSGHCTTSYVAPVTPRAKRSLTISFCMFVLLLAAAPLPVRAVGSSPAIIAGAWSGTIALTTLGGSLYTIEKSGALYRTDLSSGRWVQLGKADFGNTAFMFADEQSLYTIETDGSMYRVSPMNGSWSRLGQAGAWKDTVALVPLSSSLYSVERSGALYRTNLANGGWAQLGKPEFAGTTFIFTDGQSLYTIEMNGSLYRVNPASGAWSRVGAAGEWGHTIAGASLNGRIYTVERGGALYETNPATGAWKQIGKADFGKTEFLFGTGASLYSIETGDLYRINPANGAWVAVGK